MKTEDKIAALLEVGNQIVNMRDFWDNSDNVDDVLWAAQAYINRAIEVIRKEEEEHD